MKTKTFKIAHKMLTLIAHKPPLGDNLLIAHHRMVLKKVL